MFQSSKLKCSKLWYDICSAVSALYILDVIRNYIITLLIHVFISKHLSYSFRLAGEWDHIRIPLKALLVNL